MRKGKEAPIWLTEQNLHLKRSVIAECLSQTGAFILSEMFL
jgi:hypothetical protein